MSLSLSFKFILFNFLIFCGSLKSHATEVKSIDAPIKLVYFDNNTINKIALKLVKIYKGVGIDVQLIEVPGARATYESNSGIVDGEVARNNLYGKSHPNLIRVDPPLLVTVRYAFFKKELKSKIRNLDDLKKYSVGYVAGMPGISEMLNTQVKIISTRDKQVLMNLIQSGRIEIGVDSSEIDDIQLLFKAHTELDWVELERVKIHHYLHKKNKKLVPVISEAIKRFEKSGRL